ncbi:hypothetical protein Taro_034549 [Colocasia esculenta]|uniref:Uncharacterized protein n=1 Tax=Colocasia esculenta TaxID=4460 RepID=A0A843W7Y1_COLES|nr:hypothetical protein [Colocasia esculenta]
MVSSKGSFSSSSRISSAILKCTQRGAHSGGGGTPKASVFDGLLSPENRLLGVFLQKLRGKSVIEAALSATAVDVTVEIFADVLNKDNLGGAAMVCFFDCATKEQNLG